jgi:hypothetical protein
MRPVPVLIACALSAAAIMATALCASEAAAATPAAGEREFPAFTVHVIAKDGNHLGQTSLVDVTHSGHLDWISGEQGSANHAARVWWFEYRSSDAWVEHLIGTDTRTDVGGTAFDVDGDGYVDYVNAGVWFRNPGAAGGAWKRYEVGGIGNAHDCVAADIDGDGRLDLVAMSDSGGLWWYKIPADCTQPWIAHRIGDGVHGGIAPHGVGDLNGDGMPDIVRSDGWFENVDHGASWIWHGNLPGGHPAPYKDCTRAWIADLNHDGRNDVVMTDSDIDAPGGRVRWFENLDGKGLSWREHVIATGKGDLHTLALADFTGRGALDVFSGEGPATGPGRSGATGEHGDYKWYIWENVDGAGGSWREHVIYQGAIECHEGVAADVDGDGAVDICSKPWNGGTHLFLRNTHLDQR